MSSRDGAKLPYLPLFFGDFLASTAEWEGEERALYLLLLGHQWSIGSLPADAEKLRRISGWSAKTFRDAWPTVSSKFELRDGRLYNARLENHRSAALEISEKRSKAGRRGAERRWGDEANEDGEASGQANGKGMASATDLQCHPIQSNPTEEVGGSLLPSSEGDLSPVLPSTGPGTAQRATENRRRLATLTASTLKPVPQ